LVPIAIPIRIATPIGRTCLYPPELNADDETPCNSAQDADVSLPCIDFCPELYWVMSMIQLGHPEALFLIPLWGIAVWQLPRLGLLRPLRILTFLFLMLAWLDPSVNRITPGLDLWVLNDFSDSAKETVQPRLAEMEELLRESKGPQDRIFHLDFAEEALLRDEAAATVLPGRRDATAIGNALDATLSQLRPNRNARLLLLSDGFATDALDRAGERLLQEDVPLDLRLLGREAVEDVRVASLTAPMRTRPDEPFLIETLIEGPTGKQVEVSLIRDGTVVRTESVQLVREQARMQWMGRLDRPGAVQYEVRISVPEDPYLGNNRQAQWVEARGGRRVMLLSAYPDDPIAGLLEASGMEVELITDPEGLTTGRLSGVAAVWIHNVWAADIPREFLEALPFYVREQAGGLVMVGGKASFGAGGYFESPIDELLPVSMELKEEDRRSSVALGIVMDRSGSMSASAGGMTKMDLANSGAARAIELLGASDAVTVFAVDTKAHQIVPLSQVGNNRTRLLGLVRRIRSTGGGIYVFNGLEAAWKQLKSAPQLNRHVILFSDAADSEQPQGVNALLREMTANNTTVSVIALGSKSDPDAAFLEEIAQNGQGRIFYNSDAATLPEVFAQETVTVSRSAFLDEPVGLDAAAGWAELAANPLEWPEQVDGYNLSYLREGAAESLRTTDEYQAPLLAHWMRGTGRVAAVSFPLGGDYSESIRGWKQAGDLVRTLGRWSLRPEMDPGLALRVRRKGKTVRLQLYNDDSWNEAFSRTPPRVRFRAPPSEQAEETRWRRVRPGLLETDLPVTAGSRIQGAIRIGERAMPFGPVSGILGAEWRFDREVQQTLLALSTASGGINRLDLSGVWEHEPRRQWNGTGLLWLIAAGGFFILEAILDRLGGRRLEWEWQQGKRWKEARKFAKTKKSTSTSPAKPSSPAMPESPRRRSAFQQARHRSRRS